MARQAQWPGLKNASRLVGSGSVVTTTNLLGATWQAGHTGRTQAVSTSGIPIAPYTRGRRVQAMSSKLQAMKILLPVDASSCSAEAVREVSQRPWPVGTTVRVLS